MNKEIVSTNNAPAAIGPYSQAVKAGNFLFTSGQIPLDPATGELVSGDIKKAAERCLENLKAVLEAGGSDLSRVVKTTVFIKDMKDFAAVNEIYSRYFTDNHPSRSCIEVSGLPKGAEVEVEAVALVK